MARRAPWAASAVAPAAAASLRAVPGPAATSPTNPLTARDAATALTRLAGAFADGFGRLADAAPAGGPPARRVALAAASRLLGAHAQALAALVPESVLLADARAAGERDPLVLPEAPEALLAALDAALAEVLARTTPVAYGALARVGATVRAELAGLLEAVAAAGAAPPG